jgi:hypothetical protein
MWMVMVTITVTSAAENMRRNIIISLLTA